MPNFLNNNNNRSFVKLQRGQETKKDGLSLGAKGGKKKKGQLRK